MTLAQKPTASQVTSEGPRSRPAPWLPALVLLGVGALVVWRTGFAKVPNLQAFETIARGWPRIQVPPTQAYVLREALGQALYHALGWQGTGHFIALQLMALGVAALLLIQWLLRQLGTQRGVIATSLLLVSPLTAVLLLWIGMYDAFSLLIWVLLLLSLRRKAGVQAAVAVLGGLQNFEQFAISVVLLALLPEMSRRLGLRVRPVALMAGAVAGKIALEVYLRSVHAVDGSRITVLGDAGIRHMVLWTFAAMAPIIAFSALGGLWVPVMRALPGLWADATTSLRWRAAVAAALVVGVGMITGDHTRVMVLVLFPLLVLGCMQLARRHQDLRDWLRQLDTWLVLLIPPVIVWGSHLLPMGLYNLKVWGL